MERLRTPSIHQRDNGDDALRGEDKSSREEILCGDGEIISHGSLNTHESCYIDSIRDQSRNGSRMDK